MQTVTIDDVVWHVEATGVTLAAGEGEKAADTGRVGVRFSRPGEARTRIGYVSDDIPLEQVPDMVLKVTFDEGIWETDAAANP